MTIKEYINEKSEFEMMPYMTIYNTILELIKDGYVDAKLFDGGGKPDVENAQSKSKWKVCG